MNLGRARELVRPVFSLENEYRVRALAGTLMPSQRPSIRRGYHFCNWKTGSQWVRLVLSDPRFHMRTGLPARLHYNGVGGAPALVPGQMPRSDRFISTPLFAGRDLLERVHATSEDRAVFVTRHPRDLLVSFYFSNLESHPLNQDVAARRVELQPLSVEDGLIRTMDHGFDEMVRIGDSWSADAVSDVPCPTKVFPFEDLSGEQAHATWTELLEHISGTTLSKKLVERLLATYSADNMRGPSPETSKLRDRSTAGWEHHFTGRVEDEFLARYADVERRWGYQGHLAAEATTR